MSPEKPETIRLIPGRWIAAAARGADAIATIFVRAKLTPNTISVLSFAAGLAAGVLFALGRPLAAWAGLVASGLLDAIDGRVAARTGRTTRFGAILDSSLDRYAEFSIFAGLAYHFRGRWISALAWFAFLGGMMVSYTRARAEGLGVECRVGFMQRLERFVLLGTAALAGAVFGIFDAAMTAALGIIALLSHLTAAQRLLAVKRAERRDIGKG